jgi:hypothetical protein
MIIKAITDSTLYNHHVKKPWGFRTAVGSSVGEAEQTLIKRSGNEFPEANYITNFQYREVFSNYEASGTVVTLEKNH